MAKKMARNEAPDYGREPLLAIPAKVGIQLGHLLMADGRVPASAGKINALTARKKSARAW